MTATRADKSTQTPGLDPDKSHDLRLLPVIAEQASIMEELKKNKKLEDFNARDLIRFG